VGRTGSGKRWWDCGNGTVAHSRCCCRRDLWGEANEGWKEKTCGKAAFRFDQSLGKLQNKGYDDASPCLRSCCRHFRLNEHLNWTKKKENRDDACLFT
jgi:hypothetical protein